MNILFTRDFKEVVINFIIIRVLRGWEGVQNKKLIKNYFLNIFQKMPENNLQKVNMQYLFMYVVLIWTNLKKGEYFDYPKVHLF